MADVAAVEAADELGDFTEANQEHEANQLTCRTIAGRIVAIDMKNERIGRHSHLTNEELFRDLEVEEFIATRKLQVKHDQAIEKIRSPNGHKLVNYGHKPNALDVAGASRSIMPIFGLSRHVQPPLHKNRVVQAPTRTYA